MKHITIPHFLALAAALLFGLATAQAATVMSISPAPNSVKVLPDTKVIVTFSDPIDQGSVAAGFSLIGSFTGPHAGSVTWNGASTVLTFVPNAPLARGEPFAIGVSSQVTASGTPITPWVSQFIVASIPNDGQFSQGITFGTGLGPASVCPFDVDGDGFIDITAGNSSEQLGNLSKTISFLKGIGNCQFATKVDYVTGSAAYVMPYGVAMGRLRPNGPVCAVVANWASTSIAVLPFDGVNFGAPENIPLDGTPFRVALGDFDGDGYLDIAVCLDVYLASGVRILWNDKTGHFHATDIYSINPGNVGINEGMTIGDVNGDGLPDVLTSDFSHGGHFSVFLNQGNRTFPHLVDYSVGPKPASLAVADLDGDGKLDIVTANQYEWIIPGITYHGSVTIYPGNGDGTFDVNGRKDYPVNGAPHDLVIADLNGDGHPDVATANVANDPADLYAYRSVTILFNNGVGGMTRREDVPVRASGYPQPWAITACDFDGDGDLDLATANWNGTSVSILRNAPVNISGTVYRDLNNNCVRDTGPGNGEIGVGGRLVKIDDGIGGIYYAVTELDGTFEAVVPDGNYTVSPVDATCPVSFSGSTTPTPITGLRFGLPRECKATVSCVSRITWPCPPGLPCVHTGGHYRNLCPCEPFQYAVTVRNTGTDPLKSGSVVRLRLPQEVMFCDPFPNPISDCTTFNIDGGLGTGPNGQGIPNPYPACNSDCSPNTGQIVIWTLKHTLAPGAQCIFFVNVQVANVPPGTINVCATPSLWAKGTAPGMPEIPLKGNVNGFITGPDWCDNILCSYDPNDLAVSPAGCGPNGNVPPGTTLTYRVRFQNLGTAEARRVVVRNHLDPDLDPSTLEILSTSHTVTDFTILPGQQMTWTFDSINLPAAASDELGSRGEIRYRIRPKSSAGVGTTIHNTADIYFDLNDPVTTVTTLNTITGDVFPVAAFDVRPRLGSPGFINDFVYTGGTMGATFLWDFGPDATPRTSTQQNPAGVVFGSAGPHFVTLRTSLGDCQSEPAVRIVTAGRPRLAIDATPGGPLLSWEGDGYRVQETDSLTPPIVWRPMSPTPVSLDGSYSVQLPAPGSTRFYRLEQAQ